MLTGQFGIISTKQVSSIFRVFKYVLMRIFGANKLYYVKILFLYQCTVPNDRVLIVFLNNVQYKTMILTLMKSMCVYCILMAKKKHVERMWMNMSSIFRVFKYVLMRIFGANKLYYVKILFLYQCTVPNGRVLIVFLNNVQYKTMRLTLMKSMCVYCILMAKKKHVERMWMNMSLIKLQRAFCIRIREIEMMCKICKYLYSG